MRIEVTFKRNEKELYEFLKEKSKYISTSGYVKQPIAKEIEKDTNDIKNKSIGGKV